MSLPAPFFPVLALVEPEDVKSKLVVLPGSACPDIARHIDARRFKVEVVLDHEAAKSALKQRALALIIDENTNGLTGLKEWVLAHRQQCYCILIITKNSDDYAKTDNPRVKKLKADRVSAEINVVLSATDREELVEIGRRFNPG